MMKPLVLAALLMLAGQAQAAEPVTIRKLVEHYYPYYFKFVGPQEATGKMPMMSSAQFVTWLHEAGADDAAVQRTLALRNARLEVASAFDFIFSPLERHTGVDNMADLLLKLTEAGKQYQLHTGEVPRNMTDLWQNSGLPYWNGPYIKPEMLQPFFKRFQFMVLKIGLFSDAEGSPPPPCPTPECISWAWLKFEGLPPAYTQQLDLWLDTDPTPAQGKIRLMADGSMMYLLMRTNK